MKYRSTHAHLLLPLLVILVACLLSLTTAAESIEPISAPYSASTGTAVNTAETTGESTTQPPNSTSVGGTAYVPEKKAVPAISYGLRVLAAREEMVMAGLCGNEIGFTVDDIRRAMNLSSVTYVTIKELPSPQDGTLFVGSVGASVGQVIAADSLHLMSFAAANDEKPSEATVKLGVNGSDYAVTCRLRLVDRLNFTPTVALAPDISLTIETYRDLPLSGTVSAYDPEGDEMTYEIVRYASHGRITLTDRHTGAYTYTPDAGYIGTDRFDYVVRDALGNYSTAATVSITVSERPAGITYADLDNADAPAAILAMSQMGLMNGTQLGSSSYFKPENTISRLEFLVTALEACGVTAEMVSSLQEPSVADCEAIPEAMRPYVSYALQKNYITPRTVAGQSCFVPNDPITRAEAAVILSNIIGYATEDTVTAFADADTLPTWSSPALTSLSALGILVTPNGKANATDAMTRDMTADWLWRTIRVMK